MSRLRNSRTPYFASSVRDLTTWNVQGEARALEGVNGHKFYQFGSHGFQENEDVRRELAVGVFQHEVAPQGGGIPDARVGHLGQLGLGIGSEMRVKICANLPDVARHASRKGKILSRRFGDVLENVDEGAEGDGRSDPKLTRGQGEGGQLRNASDRDVNVVGRVAVEHAWKGAVGQANTLPRRGSPRGRQTYLFRCFLPRSCRSWSEERSPRWPRALRGRGVTRVLKEARTRGYLGPSTARATRCRPPTRTSARRPSGRTFRSRARRRAAQSNASRSGKALPRLPSRDPPGRSPWPPERRARRRQRS
jgi:hypothetical protein